VSELQANILEELNTYYSEKIREYGQSPRGVDWNSEDGQFLRYKQLLKLVQVDSGFSIADVGCGYGALIDYLKLKFKNYEYHGIDLSQEMIAAARARYSRVGSMHFHVAAQSPAGGDYCVASGIFNIRFEYSEDVWWSYIVSTLDQLHESSRRGFAFNCLTQYSDVDKMRDYLYYASPCKLFDWCKKKYSSQVALLHDYGLYEFTILVKK
jgi:SAM-dependent methyltransferase